MTRSDASGSTAYFQHTDACLDGAALCDAMPSPGGDGSYLEPEPDNVRLFPDDELSPNVGVHGMQAMRTGQHPSPHGISPTPRTTADDAADAVLRDAPFGASADGYASNAGDGAAAAGVVDVYPGGENIAVMLTAAHNAAVYGRETGMYSHIDPGSDAEDVPVAARGRES